MPNEGRPSFRAVRILLEACILMAEEDKGLGKVCVRAMDLNTEESKGERMGERISPIMKLE